MSSDSREDIYNPPRKRIKLGSISEENRKEVLGKVEAAREEMVVQQMFLKQVEEMRNEIKCGICREEFIAPTTLNCSHTFCNYCITMWKKKKKSCPICQVPITSQCRSLIIESFVTKLMENQPEEVKRKRQELVQTREKCEEVGREISKRSSHESNNFVEAGNADSVDALFRFLRYVRCPECGETLGSDFDIDSDLHLSETNDSTTSEPEDANTTEAEAGEKAEANEGNTVAAYVNVPAIGGNADATGTDTVVAGAVINTTADSIQLPSDSDKTT